MDCFKRARTHTHTHARTHTHTHTGTSTQEYAYCIYIYIYTQNLIMYVALHEVTWCMVVWCTQNAPRRHQFFVAMPV